VSFICIWSRRLITLFVASIERKPGEIGEAFALTLALQMATIYVIFLNPIFKTVPLTISELTITMALSSIVFCAVEIKKYIRRLKDIRKAP
jgi:hypothetical protein